MSTNTSDPYRSLVAKNCKFLEKWATKSAWQERYTLMKIFKTWYSSSTDQTAIPKKWLRLNKRVFNFYRASTTPLYILYIYSQSLYGLPFRGFSLHQQRTESILVKYFFFFSVKIRSWTEAFGLINFIFRFRHPPSKLKTMRKLLRLTGIIIWSCAFLSEVHVLSKLIVTRN